MAQAAHNNGGSVIVQVQRIVKERTKHSKSVKIPGYLVDAVVVVPEQAQLCSSSMNRFISGDFMLETRAGIPLPLNERKVIARRALLEVAPGNVSVGISDDIDIVAREEEVNEDFALTVEIGSIGGICAQGILFEANAKMRAMLDMPSQFDFYDGGGLDICFLNFTEADQAGNVNVHRLKGKIVGTGGFVDICQNSDKVIFGGTLTVGGLKIAIEDGKVKIHQEGNSQAIISQVPEITFNGKDALRRGQEVLYITERAVFRLTPEGLELCEIAPGMDLEKDIIGQMGFRPKIAEDLKEMDHRLFLPEPMGIHREWHK
jgi:acetate CoA-transferase